MSIYISLEEATKLCNYSQEYLSLRARYGKLKAKKIGRNWVTTEEWLKEYLSKTEGYNNGKTPIARFAVSPGVGDSSKVRENLSAEEIKPNPLKANQAKKIIFASAAVILLLASGIFLKTDTAGIFKDYGNWLVGWFKEKKQARQEISLTKEQLMEIEKNQTKEITDKFQEEFSKLKKTGLPVKEIIKEVKRITEVQPVKEITKETIKVDDEALKKFREDIARLEGEIAKRLYAPGGVVNQPIYITEPVRSPKIYQENGEIVLQTLSSGNIILSAATGLQLFGSQVVIKSTSLLNPLISLLSPTRIEGNLTVTGSINGGALNVSSLNVGSLNSNATITAASFASAANDSTVRKSGEEVFREIVPISRYDIPAQTGTTTYFRISKTFEQNPLTQTPTPLPGASRVYKLIVKYSDNIPVNSSSSWRIFRPSAATTSDTFGLPGQNLSSTAEGIATTTPNLAIPTTDWQVDVKLSEADVGKTLRIFQIYLAAFDKIN